MSQFKLRNAIIVDGNLDVDATVEAFTNALVAWCEQERNLLARVRAACVAAFDGYPKGTRLPKPNIVSYVMLRMGATPLEWRDLEEKINIVLQDRKTFDIAFSSSRRAGGIALTSPLVDLEVVNFSHG